MIEEIQREIENINILLKDKYKDLFSLNRGEFKSEILKNVGSISKLKKLEKEELKNFGIVVGVDGSTNRVGGAYPHYIDLFQALAKPTVGEDIYLSECDTPMVGELNRQEQYQIDKRNKTLSELEIDVAIYSIKHHQPSLIMMDGGLIRYRIDAKDRYEELVELCEEKNIILIGVIEDIKTNIISRANNIENSFFDRELLYGRLEVGEFLEIKNQFNKKFEDDEDSKYSLSSAFLRTSSFAAAIGIDILTSQVAFLKDSANLVYSLTPYNSRGIPLWLDIVDREVRITDSLVKTMLEEYLDRDIYERFFVSERNRRSL